MGESPFQETFQRRCLRIPSALLVTTLALSSAEATDRGKRPKRPKPVDIIRAAEATAKKLSRSPASWISIQALPDGRQVHVEVLHTPDVKRYVLREVRDNGTRILAVVIQRHDVWYVAESGKLDKYGPYEAVFYSSLGYLHLALAGLRFAAHEMTLATYEGVESGVATYREPIASETDRMKMIAQIARMKELLPQLSKETERRRWRHEIRALQELVGRGIAIRIDLSTGIVVENRHPGVPVRTAHFEWLDKVDRRKFATEAGKWRDHTDDPTAGNRTNLAMIAYCSPWRPGRPSPDPDVYLVEVTTGRLRRVPFYGLAGVPGCFSKDRRKVYIAGFTGAPSTLQPWEIDLRTGANRLLGSRMLAGKHVQKPCLSPDGTTLAVAAMARLDRMPLQRIYLMDVASGQARAIGQPLDTAYLSWLPSGDGLVLVARKHVATDRFKQSTIVRMDMDGKITPIISGNMPVMLRAAERILFRAAGGLWKTCDLSGGNVTLVRDGLASCSQPAPGPDGRSMIMMRYDPDRLPARPDGKAPLPVLIPLGAGDERPLIKARGFWMYPAWR